MTRLLDLGVQEQFISGWAVYNVFVPKKDPGTTVTADFWGLNNATATDAYPTEDVRITLS